MNRISFSEWFSNKMDENKHYKKETFSFFLISQAEKIDILEEKLMDSGYSLKKIAEMISSSYYTFENLRNPYQFLETYEKKLEQVIQHKKLN